jgi:Flp pilus assembly protein TadB
MWLDRNGHRSVKKLAALAIVAGLVLGCVGYLYHSMWMRGVAVLLWLGGTLALFGFRRRSQANNGDKDAPGPGCLY